MPFRPWNHIRIRWHCIFSSEDKAAQKKVLDRCHFGGGCINDTIIHLATSAMPFGGIGESGNWGDITGKPDSMSLHITGVLWIKRPGWIFRCGIKGIISLRGRCCGCFKIIWDLIY